MEEILVCEDGDVVLKNILLVHPVTPSCFIEAICKFQVQVTFEFSIPLAQVGFSFHSSSTCESQCLLHCWIPEARIDVGKSELPLIYQHCLKYSSNSLKLFFPELFLIHWHSESSNQEWKAALWGWFQSNTDRTPHKVMNVLQVTNAVNHPKT